MALKQERRGSESTVSGSFPTAHEWGRHGREGRERWENRKDNCDLESVSCTWGCVPLLRIHVAWPGLPDRFSSPEAQRTMDVLLFTPSPLLAQCASHRGPFPPAAEDSPLTHKYNIMRITPVLTGYSPSPEGSHGLWDLATMVAFWLSTETQQWGLGSSNACHHYWLEDIKSSFPYLEKNRSKLNDLTVTYNVLLSHHMVGGRSLDAHSGGLHWHQCWCSPLCTLLSPQQVFSSLINTWIDPAKQLQCYCHSLH